jgi:hypothetical protein
LIFDTRIHEAYSSYHFFKVQKKTILTSELSNFPNYWNISSLKIGLLIVFAGRWQNFGRWIVDHPLRAGELVGGGRRPADRGPLSLSLNNAAWCITAATWAPQSLCACCLQWRVHAVYVRFSFPIYAELCVPNLIVRGDRARAESFLPWANGSDILSPRYCQVMCCSLWSRMQCALTLRRCIYNYNRNIPRTYTLKQVY